MSATVASYLDVYLDPFLQPLRRSDVTDIHVNRPGEFWIETLGGVVEQHTAPDIDDALLLRLARQIASLTHQGINREHPLLAATLPGGYRVQVVGAPATRGPMAMTIRKHVSASLGLDDYAAQGAFDRTRGSEGVDPIDEQLGTLYGQCQWLAFLRLAVRARKTIVIAGGTATGKTTFVNALMREIPAEERLLVIEDTPELEISHPNAVGMVAVRGRLGEASVAADDLLLASLRMRPDRIILGELRGAEAYTFLRAVNTGHPGSLTTVHADSPAKALEQIALAVLQSGTQLRREDILRYADSVVDVVVQLAREQGQRRVKEIAWRKL